MYSRTNKSKSTALLKIGASLLLVAAMVGCASQESDLRSGPAATIQIGLDDLWGQEGLQLVSTVSAFEIQVECDGGYSQTVTTTEFSLPIRNTNCVAKLTNFMRNNDRLYRPKPGQNFITWQPSDRAVFTCSEGAGCLNELDLNVYVLKQLFVLILIVFSEIRYKFSENIIGDDVVIQQSDINFSKVVVGDEPPPFTLRAAYEGAQAGKIEFLAECNSFQIGGELTDVICEITSLNSFCVSLAPMPEGELTSVALADLFATSSQLLAADDGALLIDQGQFGIGRGGFTVALPTDGAEQYIFAMTTSGSDSYTYHRVVRAATQSYAVGGTINGLDAGESVALLLNGESQSYSANGDFSFTTLLSDREGYTVEIATPPTGKTCAVANGDNTVDGSRVDDIKVTCSRVTL
jgi:hypothetical protein